MYCTDWKNVVFEMCFSGIWDSNTLALGDTEGSTAEVDDMLDVFITT